MHSRIAAGKLTDIAFDDERKRIVVSAKIVDDDEWAKVTEGVYTGFSHRYVRRWADPDTSLTRYTAEPSEISLVDLPCLPDATFEVVKDGASEMRKFQTSALALAEIAREKMRAEVKAKVEAQCAETDALFGKVFSALEALRKNLMPTREERLAIEKCGRLADDMPIPAKAALRAGPEPGISTDQAFAALAAMSSEDRALALTKLSLRNPGVMIKNLPKGDEE